MFRTGDREKNATEAKTNDAEEEDIAETESERDDDDDEDEDARTHSQLLQNDCDVALFNDSQAEMDSDRTKALRAAYAAAARRYVAASRTRAIASGKDDARQSPRTNTPPRRRRRRTSSSRTRVERSFETASPDYARSQTRRARCVVRKSSYQNGSRAGRVRRRVVTPRRRRGSRRLLCIELHAR